MNQQTYYPINQTPQLQNQFNGSIWNSLEGAARTEAGKVDTLYVITGPAYDMNASEDDITYLYASSSSILPSKLRVPDYYWKAFLKVKWEKNKVVDASAIAFWFEHRNYEKSESYDQNDAANGKPPFFCSVDALEALIGFDLFTNLPDDLEAAVEANTSWTLFQNFK